MKTRLATPGTILACVLLTWLEGWPIRAQSVSMPTKDEAALVIEGTVREVFSSPRRDRVDYLVQIEVKRSELGKTPRVPFRVLVPAPGDVVYVHSSGRTPAAQGSPNAANGGSADSRAVPAERSQVRAYLVPNPRGGWDGTSPDWFVVAANEPNAANPTEPPPVTTTRPSGPVVPTTPPASNTSALKTLGISGDPLDLKGHFVVRVNSLEQGSPAQRAGLEPGDVIVAANDRELEGLDQLDEIVRKGGPLNLVVLDVHSGKAARVAVDPARTGQAPEQPPVVADSVDPSRTSKPVPVDGSRKSLGVSAETVSLGQRTALKIVRVEPGSPAEKAGIEPGDVIVAANGSPMTGIEQLGPALRKSGPKLELTIRDTRTGNDVPVTVTLGGAIRTEPVPIPEETRVRPGAGRGLGAVTELFFLDPDPAAKISEIQPNSPAARAGLKPGDVIVEANGTPILHPNTLNEVVARSGPSLKLTVVDSRSGKKTSVEVDLGEGR